MMFGKQGHHIPMLEPKPEHLVDLLRGKTIYSTLKHQKTDTLLPLLARSLSFSIASRSNEVDILNDLRRFSDFTRTCRKLGRPFATTKALTQQEASQYHRLSNLFLEGINRRKQCLSTLNDIFAAEIGINSKLKSGHFLEMLLVDLPYIFNTWTRIWIGVLEANWSTIWQLTEYLKFLRSRNEHGLLETENWVSTCLSRTANSCESSSKQGNTTEQNELGRLRSKSWQKEVSGYENEIEEDAAWLESFPLPSAKNDAKDYSVTPPPMNLEGRSEISSPSSVARPAALEGKSLNHKTRPHEGFHSPKPTSPLPLIDRIISKYAEIPRRKVSPNRPKFPRRNSHSDSGDG